jgi:hypothetical protein
VRPARFLSSLAVVGLIAMTSCRASATADDHGKAVAAAAAKAWARMFEILARILPPTFPDRDRDMTKFGAEGADTTDCTKALADAIAACHRVGGGWCHRRLRSQEVSARRLHAHRVHGSDEPLAPDRRLRAGEHRQWPLRSFSQETRRRGHERRPHPPVRQHRFQRRTVDSAESSFVVQAREPLAKRRWWDSIGSSISSWGFSSGFLLPQAWVDGRL